MKSVYIYDSKKERVMKVVYLTEPGTMEIAEEEIPEVRKGCALVRIEYNGICGSDVHFYKDGRVGDCVLHGPFVLGHEVSGTVTEVGEGVTELKAGDRVALEPGYANSASRDGIISARM